MCKGERREPTQAKQAEWAKTAAARELANQTEQDEKAHRQDKAAALAVRLWQCAEHCSGHPYLTKKRVFSHGLKVGDFPKWKLEGNVWRKITVSSVLLVPMFDESGRLWNLQGIFTEQHPEIEGTKHFLSGGRKSGLFFTLGEPTNTLLICEGYATGATLHEQTGHQTFVAFDCGNLAHVAIAIRKQNPGKRIVICADNDAHLPNNPGVTHAKKAALAVGGYVSIPSIPGDWNDVAAMEAGL